MSNFDVTRTVNIYITQISYLHFTTNSLYKKIRLLTETACLMLAYLYESAEASCSFTLIFCFPFCGQVSLGSKPVGIASSYRSLSSMEWTILFAFSRCWCVGFLWARIIWKRASRFSFDSSRRNSLPNWRISYIDALRPFRQRILLKTVCLNHFHVRPQKLWDGDHDDDVLRSNHGRPKDRSRRFSRLFLRWIVYA